MMKYLTLSVDFSWEQRNIPQVSQPILTSFRAYNKNKPGSPNIHTVVAFGIRRDKDYPYDSDGFDGVWISNSAVVCCNGDWASQILYLDYDTVVDYDPFWTLANQKVKYFFEKDY